MLKKYLISLVVVTLFSSSTLSAYSLQEAMKEALDTNPTIQERLKNFRATQQDLHVAESEYYPSLDLRASVGHNEAGNLKSGSGSDWNHNVASKSYNNYESSLTLTQNIFDGFSTTHKVDFEEAQILSAAYKYLEVSNDVAFKMTDAYLNVLSSYELVGTARENVQINETIYNKVKDLFESGLTTDSEVKKIQSTLSLARSNLTVQKNNARDAEFKYRRVLGRLPDVREMQRPILDIQMPTSMQRAALYSVENNPSLLVSRYNIKGAQSLHKQTKKEYYPSLDMELTQMYNDSDEAPNGFDTPDDRFRARLVLNYNLFRGGADKANIQKHVSKINQEIEIQRTLKREVIEGLDLSWNAYNMIEDQLKDLREYRQFSEKTLELYKEEYDLGRRSLLDLLSAQNDVINSRSQIIKAEYDFMFAQYRVLDAMGLLVVAVNGTADEFTSKVNLYGDDDAREILDTIPTKLDVDEDNIVDNIDLCDNSLEGNNIMPYGCKKLKYDSDFDGISDDMDECPSTVVGAEVNSKGCELDSDGDGVVDRLDECANTPIGYGVNKSGCTNLVTMQISFKKGSSALPENIEKRVGEFADYMKKHPNIKAKVVGHTSRTSVSGEKYNLNLSKQRAKIVEKELNKFGIHIDRLSADGKGFSEPVADNETLEGRVQNRRVEIELIRDNEEEL